MHCFALNINQLKKKIDKHKNWTNKKGDKIPKVILTTSNDAFTVIKYNIFNFQDIYAVSLFKNAKIFSGCNFHVTLLLHPNP